MPSRVFTMTSFANRSPEMKYFKLHTFLVNDPGGIKHVLIDNADNYIRGGVEQRTLRTWPIKGFAAYDGEEWRQRRRTMSSSFDYSSILENSAFIVDAAQRVLGWMGPRYRH